VLAGPIGGIGLAHRQSNCAFYVAWTDHFQVPNGRHFPRLLFHAFLQQSVKADSGGGVRWVFSPHNFPVVRIRTLGQGRETAINFDQGLDLIGHLDDDVANMNPDPQFDTLVLRQRCIALGHASLDLNGAAGRIRG
jgi:hypothetical protein